MLDKEKVLNLKKAKMQVGEHETDVGPSTLRSWYNHLALNSRNAPKKPEKAANQCQEKLVLCGWN